MSVTPPPLRALAPADWARVVGAAARSLAAHAPGIDRLDAEPVGDGDCGTNLAEAAQVVVSAAVGRDRTFGDLAAALAGVDPDAAPGRAGRLIIVALAAVADAARNQDRLDATGLAVGLEAAAEAVRAAAPDAPEASLVPVLEAVAAAALDAADAGALLGDLVVAAADAGFDALEAGPAVREDLAEAGVVDAGAAGLLVVVDALVAEVHGEELEPPAWDFAEEPEDGRDLDGGRYRVELRLEGTAAAVDALVTVWGTLGVEARCWDGPAGWHASVRTDDIGAVVEAALDHGRPRDLRVEDLGA